MIKSKPHACTSSTHQSCGRERQEASLTGWLLSQSKMQRKDLLNAACSQQFCTQTLCTCLTDEQAAYYFILPYSKIRIKILQINAHRSTSRKPSSSSSLSPIKYPAISSWVIVQSFPLIQSWRQINASTVSLVNLLL